MDSMTFIAIVSIITAGLTIAIGSIGPAFGEARAVATALTALAQQPDASATITRTLFVGLAMVESVAIYCFVVSMILIFANTFCNQVINVLILVWLLKRFLYRPILDAIDVREKRIAAKIADADAKESEAQKQRDEYQRKNEVFEQQRNTHMNEVLEAAKAERAKLLDAARQESEDLRGRLEQALRNEQRSLNEELGRRAREEVFAIARKVLSDLAGISLEQRMTEIFLDHLRELNTTQITELKSAFKTSSHPLLVRTAFELTPQQCAAVETGIGEILGKEKPLEFVTVPDLISGIEINSDGRKIAWSIADYLGSLAKSVDDLLKNKSEIGDAAPANSAATTLQDVDNNER